jgi:hypothetical protein
MKKTQVKKPVSGGGRSQEIPAEIEKDMAQGLQILEKWGIGLRKQEILDQVQDYLIENTAHTRFKDSQLGHNWWVGFKCQNIISLKKPERLENTRLLQ